MLLLEHFVDPPAQGVGIAIGTDACVGRADDLERGEAELEDTVKALRNTVRMLKQEGEI